MSWNTGLHGVALDIAATNDSPLRVMAGPGTGKSFALKRRVARLLEEGVDPLRILAVTFTCNAAASLVENLKNLGVAGCDRIHVGTLHSFCYSLLMKSHVLDILGRFPRPLLFFNQSGIMQFEGAPLLNDILRETNYGNKREATKSIRAFEAAWAKLQSEQPGWALDENDQAFHDALIKWLTFHKAILIGELIPLALQYLRDNPACGERQAFDHVLVDEFQDLNKAEQVLLDILAENCNHFLVGNADQSIYSFRFAHPEGIITFNEAHPGTRDETLADCRRCPQRVVELADNLIHRNYPAGTLSRLRPFAKNPDGQIAIVQWQDIQQEAQGIADFCHHLVNQSGYLPRDILILCPRRMIGYGIRDASRDSDISAHSFYYEEALEPTEAQTSLCLLSLCCDHDDRVALRYWLGLGSPSWNARGYENLRRHCQETGETPYNVLVAIVSGNLTLSYTVPLIERFRQLENELAELLDLRGYALLDRLFPEGSEWSGAIRDAVLTRLTADTEPRELLDSLKTQITQPEMPEEGNFARVMSLHKSKGLTSRIVIVAGCIEGLCPVHNDDLTPDEKEAYFKKQRRLFYVATTRCREILVLSSVLTLEKRVAYKIGALVRGRSNFCQTITSRFINELGPNTPQAKAGQQWINSGFQ
jgi:DNA helicase-2/ATP-dependent DNA helicase PcrA